MTALLRSDARGADQPGHRAAGAVGLLACAAAAGGRRRARRREGDADTPLRPGEVRILRVPPHTEDIPGGGVDVDARLGRSRPASRSRRSQPGGEFPAKTVVGRDFTVSADVFGDGHDVLAADLLWRPADATDWQRIPMRKLANDRWEARVRPDRIGLYRFAVEGWWDQWGTFTHDLHAKVAAGQDVTLEIQEGRQLIDRPRCGPRSRSASLTAGSTCCRTTLTPAMKQADRRPFAARSAVHSVRVDRPAAEFASWYELFPALRHARPGGARHVPLRDRAAAGRSGPWASTCCISRRSIRSAGSTARAATTACEPTPGDVGSPYAIGSAEGGHDAIHPQLGTLEDFRALLQAAREHELEIAIDFAIQCAPDHPWVTQHQDWFRWRPDGSMRYAENPPKKYEDIVNPDFYGEASFPAVWIALRDVIQFWVDQGVRIFRVDNPHTKPLPFWHWMIADIQGRHPDVLFLAEAFTRPKLMYRLAKVGFSQSYTYFTWRNTKQEITEYLTELTAPPVGGFLPAEFLRQHARHQSGLPADLGPAGLSDPGGAGGDVVGPVGRLFRLRNLRGGAAAGPRGISRFGEI